MNMMIRLLVLFVVQFTAQLGAQPVSTTQIPSGLQVWYRSDRDGTPAISSAAFQWDRVPGAVSYNFYRDGAFIENRTGTVVNAVSNWMMLCSADYIFQVSSVDADGVESELSQPYLFSSFPCHLQGQVNKTLQVGVFLVKFPNAHDEPDPWTAEEYREFLFDDIGGFFKEMSWGRMQFEGKVFDWVDIPLNFGDYWSRDFYMATVFELVGANPDDYDRYVFVSRGIRLFVDPRNCAIASKQSIHMCSMPWKTTIHELGHTMGLGHSGGVTCRDSDFWNPFSPVGPNLDQLNEGDGDLVCNNSSGENIDPMGGGGDGFHAFNRRQLGFFLPGQVETAELSDTGSVHVLLALEAPNPPLELNSVTFAASGSIDPEWQDELIAELDCGFVVPRLQESEFVVPNLQDSAFRAVVTSSVLDLTWTWTQIGGPSVNLSDADAVVSFIAPEGTDLTFQLEFSDGTNTIIDTVTMTVMETVVTAPTLSYPVRMVKIPLGQWSAHDKTHYFLEYRMPLGRRPVKEGVYIRLSQGQQNPGGAYVNPCSIMRIREGKDFYDPYRNIRVSLIKFEGATATVRVSRD